MFVTVAAQVYSERVEDETILLELDSGHYYGLDAVASRMWELLGELGSTDAVVQAVIEEFDVTREQLTHDVEELVRELARRNLVVISDAPSASPS